MKDVKFCCDRLEPEADEKWEPAQNLAFDRHPLNSHLAAILNYYTLKVSKGEQGLTVCYIPNCPMNRGVVSTQSRRANIQKEELCPWKAVKEALPHAQGQMDVTRAM